MQRNWASYHTYAMQGTSELGPCISPRKHIFIRILTLMQRNRASLHTYAMQGTSELGPCISPRYKGQGILHLRHPLPPSRRLHSGVGCGAFILHCHCFSSHCYSYCIVFVCYATPPPKPPPSFWRGMPCGDVILYCHWVFCHCYLYCIMLTCLHG